MTVDPCEVCEKSQRDGFKKIDCEGCNTPPLDKRNETAWTAFKLLLPFMGTQGASGSLLKLGFEIAGAEDPETKNELLEKWGALYIVWIEEANEQANSNT